jgi:hypothetical protein
MQESATYEYSDWLTRGEKLKIKVATWALGRGHEQQTLSLIIFCVGVDADPEVCLSSPVSHTLTAHGESASPHACCPPPLRTIMQMAELTRQATSRVRVEWRVGARDQMCSHRSHGPRYAAKHT